jgi:hypothetical protein
MTLARIVSTALRPGLLIGVGSALMMLPVVLGMAPSVAVTGIAIGGLAIALGIAGTASEGRGTLPVSAQAVYDRGIGFGLLVVAVLFGSAGDTGAAILFATAGVGALIVTSITRYSASTA